jgi:hypothetical protein
VRIELRNLAVAGGIRIVSPVNHRDDRVFGDEQPFEGDSATLAIIAGPAVSSVITQEIAIFI